MVWLTGAALVLILVFILAIAYALFFGIVLAAMLQPPERFGAFMRHVPAILVWGALPASRMWLWARRGRLTPGDQAPEFTLSTSDRRSRITLANFRGQRPVVLVFGSYT